MTLSNLMQWNKIFIALYTSLMQNQHSKTHIHPWQNYTSSVEIFVVSVLNSLFFHLHFITFYSSFRVIILCAIISIVGLTGCMYVLGL